MLGVRSCWPLRAHGCRSLRRGVAGVQRSRDPVQDPVGDLALRQQRQLVARPSASRIVTRLVSVPNPEPASRHRWRPGGRRPCAGASPPPARASRSRRRTRPGRAAAGAARGRRAALSSRRSAISARRSGVGSSSRVRPSPRAILGRRLRAGVKSATAAAMTRASKPGRRRHRCVARSSAARSSAVDSTRTISAPAGRATSMFPAMSVTRAPRSRAASAIGDAHLAGRAVADEAHRVDRLASPAGGDHDVAASEVGLARPAPPAAGAPPASGCTERGARRRPPTTASTIAGSSASRPTPTWPDASGPESGSTIA